MPNLFGRKYMRGQPKRTERIVGAFILGLLATILGLFLLTSGLLGDFVRRVPVLARARAAIGISERPLFVPDPQNVAPPAPPHEVRHAMTLLPQLDKPWGRELKVGRVEDRLTNNEQWAHSPEDDRFYRGTLAPALTRFDARHVYQATYSREDGNDDRIVATVSELDSADAAFGVWQIIRPDGATSIALGGGGWSDGGRRVAFWAGRYVTVVDGDADVREQVARSIASVQLSYGRPFWSELVLPREGRVADSLRYLRGEPLGIGEFSELWLADYESGLTIGVARPAAPEKVVTALRTRAASQPAEGISDKFDREGLAAAAVTFTHDGRGAAVFPAGPYVFMVLGQPAKADLVASTSTILFDRWTGAGAVTAVAMSSAGGAAGGAAPPTAGAARFAPVEGLEAPTKVERFTDNLYEKIDGREGQFRAFHFVELRFGQYLDTRNQHTYDVYLYDMGEPKNALGIYTAERSDAAESLDVGRDGYMSGTNAYYWKGKYYVNVLGPSEGGTAAAETSKRIAAAIAETIADSGATFWAEEVLPTEDRIPGSFKYKATSALGYDFLERMYLADYETDGKTYTLFAMKAADPAGAEALYRKLVEATKKYDEVLSDEPSDGGHTMVSRSLDVYAVVFHKSVFLGGLVECDDVELAKRKAAELRDRMPIDAPGEAAPAAAPPTSGEGEEGTAAKGEHSESGVEGEEPY